MAEATSDDLAARLRAAWGDLNTPLWLPSLAADLGEVAWRMLRQHFGLTRDSYGTARLLLKNANVARHIITSLHFDSRQVRNAAILVELLPREIGHLCAPEVRFFDATEIQQAGVAARAQRALEVLAEVPLLTRTLSSLVKVLHFVDAGDDEIDLSFSDPRLPFSAFLSIPRAGTAASELRVAEALLHEAMHLQLTLAEAVLPLVIYSERTLFSPWRNEHRTAQGVLHAAYVFRAISEAFLSLSSIDQPMDWQRHIKLRRATIATQLEQLRDFPQCPDLTVDGRALVARLLG